MRGLRLTPAGGVCLRHSLSQQKLRRFAASTSSSQSYSELHITGHGYLNPIREVQPRKGTSFLACDIAALTGPSNAAEYRRFDVKVSGRDAQHLIRKCEEAVKAERKVLIWFPLANL